MLKIITASHFFKITKITPRARPAVDSFIKKFVQFGFMRTNSRRYVYTALKVFGSATEDRSEYRFHINQLKDFEIQLETYYIKGDMVAYEHLPVPEPAKIELLIRDGWEDREHQTPAINYIKSDDKPINKLLEIQTGKGKSYISMRAMSDVGYRALVIVKPMYI